MSFFHSLTARVTLGSLVLAGTAAGLSIATTANQNRLDQEFGVMRTGYLQLALSSRDLQSRQNTLVDYLRDELSGERTARRVERQIGTARKKRTEWLGKIGAALEEQRDAPASHDKRLNEARALYTKLRRLEVETHTHYEALLAAPPIDRVLPDEGTGEEPAPKLARALAAHKELQRREGQLNAAAQRFAAQTERHVKRSAATIETGSGMVSRYSMIFLAVAVGVGLAVILFIVVTLRPLRRLPIAAQRIAEGDYGARIREKGPTEVVVLAREFNQMASALEERERELVRSERLATVGKMAAMITHEVRNPLSAISLNTELLEEELGELGEGAKESQSLCVAINNEIDRLTQITETYLQFARLPQPRLQSEDLAELVRGTISFMGEELSKQGIAVETEIDSDLPFVAIDHAQIKQGLLNLIRNAAEALAGAEKPRLFVAVASTSQPAGISIDIVDNGAGVPADVLPNLFEPFFTTKQSGTGLGLALTKQIVHEHGGTLSVDSRAGSGARFTIHLPWASGPSLLSD